MSTERTDLKTALDAERANRESLEACVDRDVKKIKDLQTQLTQLHALVRALVCTRTYMVDGEYIRTRGGSVLYACSSSISAERLGALLAYRATLPATPTEEAPAGGATKTLNRNEAT